MSRRDPPAWARVVDLGCVLLVVLAAAVAVSGGVRLHVAGARLSLISPWRLLLWAMAIGLARQFASPANPIYRDLPRRVARVVHAAESAGYVVADAAPDADSAGAARPVRSSGFVPALLVLFTALTVLMTYPQARHMADAVYDPGDPLLNLWAISWVAHTLPTSPAHVFDANIFAPERQTLAYSETLIAPAIVVAPLLWLGVSRIVVYNLVLLSGFVLSGVGTALLVRDLTRSRAAAVVSGVIFAFLPFRFDHVAQLQLQQAEWIPLALWAFHRVLWRGRLRDGLWLGACVAAQLFSCMYYGIYLAGYMVVVGGSLMLANVAVARTRLRVLAAGALLAFVIFAPAASAYLGAHGVVGERGARETRSLSATWVNYVAAPDTNRLYGWSAERFGALERQLFPGLVAVALAAIALWPPWSGVRAAYAIGLAFSVDLTLGFNGLLYRFLYEHLAPFRALRIPALAVVLVGFSLAVLAGFGVARLAARVKTRRARLLLTTALCAAVLAESCSIPVSLTAMPTAPPAIYADMLRDIGDSPTTTIIEVPMIFEPDPRFQDQIYMYYSTFHWQRLLNGYSGFFPPSYLELAAVMRGFPDARSLDLLRRRGARYAVVHGERLSPAEYQRMTGALDACGCGVALVARRPWQGHEISLYRLP